MDADEPTTASEMELLFELRQLLDAAGATLDQEMTNQLLADIMHMVVSLHAVVERAEEIDPHIRAEVYAQACQLSDRLEDWRSCERSRL